MTLAKEVRNLYFKAQRSLVEIKQLDDRSVILSFPLHYSGYTRVEFSVSKISAVEYLLSDFSQTLGELKDSGYSVSDTLRERLLEITKLWRIELSDDNLIRTCSTKDLGAAIHEFAEAVKTIGDAYLAYPVRRQQREEEEDLKRQVRQALEANHLRYKERQLIPGVIEEHRADFYVPPNGMPGLVLEVIPNPDKLHAEAWGFKARDIKDAFNGNRPNGVFVGVVYDAALTKPISRSIIDRVTDIPVPSTELRNLSHRLQTLGVRIGA